MKTQKIDINDPSRLLRFKWGGTDRDHHGNPLVLGRLYTYIDTMGAHRIVRLHSMPDHNDRVEYKSAIPVPHSTIVLSCFPSQLTPVGPVELGRQYQALLQVIKEYMDTVEGDLSRE